MLIRDIFHKLHGQENWNVNWGFSSKAPQGCGGKGSSLRKWEKLPSNWNIGFKHWWGSAFFFVLIEAGRQGKTERVIKQSQWAFLIESINWPLGLALKRFLTLLQVIARWNQMWASDTPSFLFENNKCFLTSTIFLSKENGAVQQNIFISLKINLVFERAYSETLPGASPPKSHAHSQIKERERPTVQPKAQSSAFGRERMPDNSNVNIIKRQRN